MRKFMASMLLASGAAAAGAWACGSAVTACKGTECAGLADGSADVLLVEASLPDAIEEIADLDDSEEESGTDSETDGETDARASLPLGHACKSDAQCANCVDGVCCSTPSCPASDQCYLAGKCSSATGQCGASPPAPNTTAWEWLAEAPTAPVASAPARTGRAPRGHTATAAARACVTARHAAGAAMPAASARHPPRRPVVSAACPARRAQDAAPSRGRALRICIPTWTRTATET
jgi:hypothetical protein